MKERKNKIIIGETKENKNYEEVVKMNKERELIKEVKENKEVEVKKNENKGIKELEGGNKMEERKEEIKELVSKVEEKRVLLIQTVFKWAQGLCPMKNVQIKIKGRYYPMIEKETGKLSVIDKVQSRKIPFDTLDRNMKFVIATVLAERKEEIEKEVEEGKRKYLEGKLNEIENLLNKF
ncbi:MAG: hypothetical protein WBI86_02435 [Defluviitoga tunisiensis]